MERDALENEFYKLRNELKVARSEISNLRQQIRSLKYTQDKHIEEVQSKINNWKCLDCKLNDKSSCNVLQEDENDNIVLEPIGYISTEFPVKKGIPRQPTLCPQLLGKLTISKNVFTNPEHALEGLIEYSHMWILFHFNRNESKHALAKVSPPRLKGDKTGVFATRSPHRPSPIGLSLVRIHCIEGSTIYFSGVDMLDKTPVLDIKPYIPQYDDPSEQELEINRDLLGVKNMTVPPGSPGIYPGNREDPDGEESDEEQVMKSLVHPLPQNVRVPSWVMTSSPKAITLTNEAEEQLNNLGKAELKPVIQRILKEDPRSTYIKQRYSNQFYTFLISDLHISCKFDDSANSVNVYRISKATRLSGEEDDSQEKC
ncbi:unnamed protein product [Nezara viridula]|uniref:TsaA-like domain-containing protein n=1 Tax=Nezara viridula TaxID=85310 RepID=A0A9P0E702_NEZVI|nr:unnamed protein product [Nezara viridula]